MTVKLASRFSGVGEAALVIVHGFTGSSDDFVKVVAPLERVRRVVLVDMPGHGDSPWLDHYDYDALTGPIAAFIENELNAPVDLLGHSLGGRVILPIAVERPDLVRSLILMDTWADQPERGAAAAELVRIWALPPTEARFELARFETGRPDPEADLIAARWGAAWRDARVERNARRLDPQAIADLGPLVFVTGPSVLARCGAVACPATVLVGERDTPFAGPSQRLAESIPTARQRVIPGAYHSPQLTHPEAWVEEVTRHLTWVDRSATGG